jgi:F-type H+-transporting ATPase subunit delta
MLTGSRRSRDAVVARLDALVDDGADVGQLGRDLFRVVDLLDAQPALRRVLTEPSVPVEARQGLVRSLLGDRVASTAVAVVAAAAAERWSRSRDLEEALEWTAVTAEAARADRAGELDRVEDELFRFGRILEGQPRLRDALSDRAAPLEAKRHLLEHLLDGKVSPVTMDLLAELLAGRQGSLAAGLERFQEVVAARRQRLVATVWVAAPLASDKKERIARVLSTQYAHEVHLNIIVEPDVLGGVRVSIGDDVIDSTVQTRMAQAARILTR